IDQHPKVCHHAHNEQGLALQLILNVSKSYSYEVIDERSKQNQETTRNTPAHVKHVTGNEQKPFFDGKIAQIMPDQQHNREEKNVFEGRENHGVATLNWKVLAID